MDDFGMEGSALEEALAKIALINRLLGGNRITIDAVRQIATACKKESRPVSITDLGCGNGDMLRALAAMGHKEGFDFRMKGIDANAYTVAVAGRLSASFPGIDYQCADIMDRDFDMEPCDIALLTLTLHHFTDQEILALLGHIKQKARMAIVVNDLQRSRLAYYLFSGLGHLCGLGAMNINDGKLSILRGFKRAELENFAEKLDCKQYTIDWKWAFRYQWIITGL